MRRFVVKLFLGLLGCWAIGFLGVTYSSPVQAADNSFVTVVHPIRWPDVWVGGMKELEIQAEVAQSRNLPVTWLVQYDNLTNEEIVAFFKNRPKNSEIGILLEVSPKMAKDSGVVYTNAPGWFRANNVFLSGYERQDREKLITTTFEKFKDAFGYYPKSIGAWHLDAYSLSFIKERYPQVLAGMVVADQLTTDGYGIWGQYWSVPFYPSKKNALMPANSKNSKLDIVLLQWAARDPLNGYKESTYSVQTGDYERHGVGFDYFKKLVSLYTNPQENQFAYLMMGHEGIYGSYKGSSYEAQLEYLKEQEKAGRFKTVTMGEFASWYRKKFPNLSLSHKIETVDVVGGEKHITWYMSHWQRVGILKDESGTQVLDWRIYDNSIPERFYWVKNQEMVLDTSLPAEVDSVRGKPMLVSDKKIGVALNPKRVQFDNGISLNPPAKLPNVSPWFGVAGVLGATLFVLRKNLKLGFLLFAGTAAWSATMIKSGLLYDFGMGFWGPNGHDGIWHIALIERLSKFSLENPVFAGEMLRNYHWFYDGLLAIVHRVTTIPVHTLYFQIIPPVLAFLIGWLTYVFVRKWRNSDFQALWAVFFVYFGGSFGWVVTLIREKSVGGESMFWANQAISTLINPPFAASLVLLLSGLIFLLKLGKKFNIYYLFFAILFFGILIQVKVYAGVLTLIGLTIIVGLRVVTHKISSLHSDENVYVFVGTLLVAFILFLSTNLGAQNLIVFSPLWFPETMVSFWDRFYWPRLANAIVAYKATGNLKIVPAEFLALSIFIIGNLGTRILGAAPVWKWVKTWVITKKIGTVELFLLSIIIAGFVLPILFIQKGNPWNTIQFSYYSLFFMAILSGVTLGEWLKNKSKVFTVYCSLLIVALTIPTTYGTLQHYLPSIPPAKLSYEELETVGFLKRQVGGAVLTNPYNEKLFEQFSAPRPLYAYTTTAYVSAFSGKPTFVADEMNLEIIGIDYQRRKEETQEFFVTQDQSWAREFLKRNNIAYLYVIRGQEPKVGEGQLGIMKIFENPEVKIYQTNKL